MKETEQLQFPDDRRYAQSHEWAKEGKTITIGITDYAQNQLGDIVFIELPEVGATLNKGDELGTVESIKAVSEIYVPISGRVQEINETLADNPALINEQPYGAGWLVKIAPDDQDDMQALMDQAKYLTTLTGE